MRRPDDFDAPLRAVRNLARFWLGLALWGLVWAVILAVLLLTLARPAHSHEWYPADCCSGYDCYPIDDAEVEPTDAGWLIRRTGEVVPYGQTRRPSERPSQDGQLHRCSLRGDPDAATLCLFVPPSSS